MPSGEVDDPEDLALLEARDLLFARLLAYRAYQQVAALFAELEAGALRRYPRADSLEQRYLGLLPEVTIGLTPEAFADLASKHPLLVGTTTLATLMTRPPTQPAIPHSACQSTMTISGSGQPNSRMPSSRPLITVPITLPRSCGAASVAAKQSRKP